MGKSVKELFKNVGFILKFVAAICCAVCCGIFGEMKKAQYYDIRSRDFLVVSCAGYLIILVAFLIVYGVDETHHVFELIFLFVGGVMNIISGIFCFVKFADDDTLTYTLILAVFALGAGILMIVDFVREVRNK